MKGLGASRSGLEFPVRAPGKAGRSSGAMTPPSAATIRRAQPSDYTSLLPLFNELDDFHRERAPWMFRYPKEVARPKSYLERLLSDPNQGVLLAEAGECVGLAIVLLRKSPDFPVFVPQSYAVIDNIVVRASARRRGIGTQLYQACTAWAEKHRAQWVEVSVYHFNEDAKRFYAQQDFQPLTQRLRKSLVAVN